MAAQNNPFTPGFGQIPPFMAGRSYVIQNVIDAFDNGPGDPNLTSIFTGARGAGKTTLLALLTQKAQEHGWIAVRVSAVPGMLEDILQQAALHGEHLLNNTQKTRLTSFGIGGAVSASWQYHEDDEKSVPNWRTRLTHLLDELDEHDCGLVISVDEIQADFDEMVQLASVYQHLASERRKISLLMAGLPYQVSRILNDKSISFLRRATRYHLGRVKDDEIRKALVETIEQGGRRIDSDALDAALEAIDGFPFMMQLVGYRMWSRAENGVIDMHAAENGITNAKHEMERNILEVTYNELSDGDLSFVQAMLPDKEPSTIRDIITRMQKSSGYVAQYRRRLLEEGVIGERGRGLVGFELPGWKKFVQKKLNGE